MMYRSLFVYGVLGVLLVPVGCDSDPEAEFELITVCIEEDEDLRVDCRITPKLSQINSYEFSWSNGSKENLINTNVSGSSSEPRFKDQSYVEELEPHGYRMTLEGFTEKLPHNTTFMCKITKQVASAYVERDNLVPCSAVSIFLKKSCIWVAGLLLYLSHTGS